MPEVATTLTHNGVIAGTGILTKLGAGTLTLTGANTYSGGSHIDAGTLSVAFDNNLGNAAGTLTLDGGTLQTTLGFTTSRGTTLNAGGGTFNVDGGTVLIHNGSVTGSGALNKSGNGTLALDGTNDYSGGTSITGGILAITDDSKLGNVAGNLILDGGTLQNNALTISNRAVTLGAGGGTFAPNNANLALQGVISGTGSLTLDAVAGTEELHLTNTNSYSGGTIIKSGLLIVTADANLGDAAGSITMDGGTLYVSGNVSTSRATLLNAGNQTLNVGTMLTHNGVISGAGTLVKEGFGTLALTGTNTYSGGTTITAGTLQIGNGGTTGSIIGNITNNSALTFNRSDALTFGGAISGTGSLTKLGAGTLTLSGANTYSGGTFNIDGGSTPFHNGVISGTGGLTKTGAGVLYLQAANNYTGTTTINQGQVTTTNVSALGNNSAVTVSSPGVLSLGVTGLTIGSLAGDGNVFTSGNLTTGGNNTSTTFSGVLGSPGGLIKEGTGTFTLTGTNTYTGGTTINAGTLQIGNGGATGSITGNITNNSALIFNRSDTLTFGGDISGNGTFTQAGTGSINLTGTNSYNGATTVNTGTLYVNGSSSNSTHTVNAGGTLGGTGTVGSVIINGGTFAPGNSIGTTNVAGNIDFSAGGTYQVEVNAAGQSDLINATGTATLTNGVVQVLPEAGTYNFSTDYTILTAAGGLGGTTFNSVTSNLAFLNPTLSYDANNVYLNLTRNDVTFTSVAGTLNQIAVSNILTQLGITNPADVKDILNQLLLLTNSGAQQAFDSLSGVQHSVNPGLSNNLMQRFLQLIRVYRGSQGWGKHFASLDTPMGHQQTVLNSGDGMQRDIHWWIQGFTGDGDIDDSAGGTIASVDYRNNGLALGVDMALSDHWTLRIAGSFANSDISSGGSDADVDSYQIAAYANWSKEDWYVDSAVGFATHDTDADRTVTVGALTGIAESDYDSDTVGASIEVGKRFTLNNGMQLTPYAGLEYSKTDREDFTETGSFANLSVDDEEHESIRSRLGLRLSKSFKTDKGTEYVPSMNITYVHEHGDEDNLMKAAFSTAPTTTFSVEGNDMDRDRLQLGFGLTAKINDNAQINFGYDGEFAGSDDYHSLNATLRVR